MVKETNYCLTEEEYEIIAKKWLKNCNVQILHHSLKPLSNNVEGFLGGHFILKVTTSQQNDEKTRLQFFVKTFPNGDGVQAKTAKELYSFEREAAFMDHYVREFKKTIPGYDATFAPKYVFGRTKEVLVFQDLSVEGYTLTKLPLTNLDIHHVKSALEALAELHAGCLAYEEIKTNQTGSKYRLFSKDYGMYKDGLLNADKNSIGNMWSQSGLKALKALTELLPEIGLTKDAIQDLFDLSCERTKPQTKFRNVLTHNDLWTKNVMFKYEDNVAVSAKLIDYQLVSYHLPAQDVLDFLFKNTAREFREKHFKSLWQFYYQKICEELKRYNIDPERVLSFDEIKKQIDFLVPVAGIKSALYKTVIYADEKYLVELVSNDDRLREFMLEDRTPSCLEMFRLFDKYREGMTGVLKELKEVVSNNHRWHVD